MTLNDSSFRGQFLTGTACFLGVFGEICSRVFGKKTFQSDAVFDSRYVRVSDQPSSSVRSRLHSGVFRFSGKMVFVKQALFRWKNFSYFQILNEGSLLFLLKNFSFHGSGRRTIRFSKIIDIRFERERISLVEEFENGINLDQANLRNFEEVDIVSDCVDGIAAATAPIVSSGSKVGRRSFFVNVVSFPFYFCIALLRNPFMAVSLFRSLFYFFQYAALARIHSLEYTLSHRDLTPANIFLLEGNPESVVILDPEVMVLSPRETDIALVTRDFFVRWGFSEGNMSAFLKKQIRSSVSAHRFLCLVLFYSVQSLAVDYSSEIRALDMVGYSKRFRELMEITPFISR